MAGSDGSDAQHLEVRAPDGTPIAVEVRGSGPPLVLVHGSIADHTTFEGFVDVLQEHFTTYALDRRGFGDTPDTPDHRIEQDFDDVAAVVAAAADRAGSPVTLFGHSYGAGCALGAGARWFWGAPPGSTASALWRGRKNYRDRPQGRRRGP